MHRQPIAVKAHRSARDAADAYCDGPVYGTVRAEKDTARVAASTSTPEQSDDPERERQRIRCERLERENVRLLRIIRELTPSP